MFDMRPNIGVVVIGINVEKVLSDCIESILNSNYPKDLLEIVYVDGGSKDQSIEVAGNYPGVRILRLNSTHPTPGRGRNAGWKMLNTPFIQFLDADTVLQPDWFINSLPHLSRKEIAAVCGNRRERSPNKNYYHVIGNMEWHYETGPCRYFGGDVLIKRNALIDTGGFDETLVAGEDPELSYRIRQKNQCILRIDKPMTLHDLNMFTFRQYLRRAYRSGYGYAEIAARFCKNKEKLWAKETIRIICKALAPIFILLAGIVSGYPGFGAIASLVFIFIPLHHTWKFKRQFTQTWGKSILYSLHICLVVFPQFAGIIRYLVGTSIQFPLQNNSSILGSPKRAGA